MGREAVLKETSKHYGRTYKNPRDSTEKYNNETDQDGDKKKKRKKASDALQNAPPPAYMHLRYLHRIQRVDRWFGYPCMQHTLHKKACTDREQAAENPRLTLIPDGQYPILGKNTLKMRKIKVAFSCLQTNGEKNKQTHESASFCVSSVNNIS